MRSISLAVFFFFFFALITIVPSLTWYQIPKSLQAAGLGKVHILLNFAAPSVGDGVGLLVHDCLSIRLA